MLDHLSLAAAPDRVRAMIHPSAVVEPGAELGTGVTVGPFCHVGPDVVLHDDVRLVSHVVVDGHTTIGQGAVLYPFCTVGLAPQDLKYKGEPTRCEIGDSVVIANNVVMGGHVSIGDGAVVGGAAAIHQFVRIGRGAMIGGVSGVEADVIPFGSVIGNRARLAGLNVIGLRRRGVDRSRLLTLRAAVRTLFWGGGVLADRMGLVRAEFGDDDLVAEVLDFAATQSKRGLIRAGSSGDEAG